MLDIDTQLRDYLDATAPAVTLEDIFAVPPGGGAGRPLRTGGTPRGFAGLAYAAATAFAVLLLVGGAAWLLRVDPTTVTATFAATAPPTTVPGFGVDAAKDVAAAYFEAYNEGDVEAVVALLVPNAEFSDNFGPHSRAAWEQLLVWNAAQGTALSPASCLLAEELVGVSVRLVCSHRNSDAVVQAVDGPAVPIRLTLVITPEGIADWKSIFEQPDFNVVGRPFTDWMTTHHPDLVDAVEFGNWSSVEDAEQNGILTAQYAAEWGAYLDANDCEYDDGC